VLAAQLALKIFHVLVADTSPSITISWSEVRVNMVYSLVGEIQQIQTCYGYAFISVESRDTTSLAVGGEAAIHWQFCAFREALVPDGTGIIDSQPYS